MNDGTAWLVAGMSMGDEGKGAVVDWLCRERGAGTVVRHNGGSQAAHRVVLADGREHVFHQFGAGTLAGARTVLWRRVLFDPLSAHLEAEALREAGVESPLDCLYVHADCAVTHVFHVAANRLAEHARGDEAYGSCGLGIGETMLDVLDGRTLTARDVQELPLPILVDRLRQSQLERRERLAEAIESASYLSDEHGLLSGFLLDDDLPEQVAMTLRDVTERVTTVTSVTLPAGDVVCEGAQGVLLDERYGFHPHTTWSRTDFTYAEEALREVGWRRDVKRIGVTRCYSTRHGAGPFPAGRMGEEWDVPDAENGSDGYQGAWRTGPLDLPLLRYARDCVGYLDGVALTCLDRLPELPSSLVIERYYEARKDRTRDFALAPYPTPGPTLTTPGAWLDRQEAMGRALGEVAYGLPVVAENARHVRSLVREALRAPIVLSGYGPTASGYAGDPTFFGELARTG